MKAMTILCVLFGTACSDYKFSKTERASTSGADTGLASDDTLCCFGGGGHAARLRQHGDQRVLAKEDSAFKDIRAPAKVKAVSRTAS